MHKMKKKTKETKESNAWDGLIALIEDYAEASRADEMKGGGDPSSFAEIAAFLELARAKLNGHIARMRRELE